MKNKPETHHSFNSLKHICLSKERVPFYSMLLFLFVILNIALIPGLFKSRGGFFDTNDVYGIFIALTLVGFFILFSIMTPFLLKKINTKVINEKELKVSVWDKIFSLWVPFGVYIIAQMIVLGFCEKISPKFNISFVVILLTGIALCGLIFVWIIICACLYFVARSIRWYFIGYLALNFAPIIISRGCYEIYNISPLVPYKSWNPLNFNLFVISAAALFNFSVVFLLVTGVIIGIFVYLWYRKKNFKTLGLTTFSIIYKILVIFLISLSAAFSISSHFIGKNQISLNYILFFLVVAMLVALVFGYFTFRRKMLFLRMGITIFAVGLSSALILGVIPAQAQKDAYTLPDKEEIESVALFLDSIENFEIDNHFEDCVDLHKMLLELFEQGYLPDETEHPYKEPECIADLWENVNFHYKLKDGKSLHREYRNLKDTAFDEFYIQFIKSDMYTYSLQKTKMDNPGIRYFRYGDDDGKWCKLPESCIEELLKTYCNELKKADKSVFYEEYETVRLTGVYDFGNRMIYIPLSFTDTRNLITQYLNMNPAR